VTEAASAWRAVDLPDHGGHVFVNGVIADAAGLLLYGSVEMQGRGLDVSRRRDVEAGGAGGGLTGVAALDGSICLFTRAAGQESAAILTSKDLRGWARVAVPGLDAIVSVATLAKRTVVVGSALDASGDEMSIIKVTDGLAVQ
jgi:hypothetical protein